MPETVMAALRQRTQLAVSADDLAAMTVTLQVRLEFSPRWGLNGRVTALGPGIEVSLARRALAASLERLTRAGLLDRQRRIAVPHAVTRIAVIHPAAAAGWSDISAELLRWSRVGLMAVRSMPTPFEGPGASAGLVATLGLASAPLEGHVPDLLLVVRGGGASASLAALDDEALARAVAILPVPVLAGLGHAVDHLTLLDRVAWRSADTPSKALGVVRDLIVAPARRARADHAAILAAVSGGLDRAEPKLAALEQRVTTEARRRAVRAAETLERSWSTVRGASQTARERLGRLDDAIARLADDIRQAAPRVLACLHADLDALMDTVRVFARRSSAQADDGAARLAAVTVRAGTLLAAADTALTTCRQAIPTLVAARAGRASTEVEVIVATARTRARDVLAHTDDGSRLAANIRAAADTLRRARETEIERLHGAVEAAVGRRLDSAAASLTRAAATLDVVDPARVLERGYALVTDTSGRVMTSAAAAAAAETLILTFNDGSFAVRVELPQPHCQDTFA